MNLTSRSLFVVLLIGGLIFSQPVIILAQQNTEVTDFKSTTEGNIKSENEALIATAKGAAERDAKVDFGNYEQLLWFSVGFGCSVFGVAAAHFGEAQPPPTRLLGKSPDYVKIYVDTYRDKLHRNRMIFAGTGCVLSLGLAAALISGGSSDNSLDVQPLEDACSGCLSLLDLADFISSCLLSDPSADCSGCSNW